MNGATQKLWFSIRWDKLPARATAAQATDGRLAVGVGEKVIWGARKSADAVGIHWCHIDLLDALTRAWVPLFVEQGLPIPVDVEPRLLWSRAKERWAALSDDDPRIDREQSALWRFAQVHDLSTAYGGTDVPPLWLVREGRTMIVGSDRHTWRLPHDEVMAVIEELGDEISARLESVDDERSRAVREHWSARAKIEEPDFIRLATALDGDRVEHIEHLVNARDPWGVDALIERGALVSATPTTRAHFSATPQLAAARMLSDAAPDDVIARVLTWIADVPELRTPFLDDLGESARRSVRTFARTRPGHHAGEALATWLRERPGITDARGRVDPHTLIHHLGVQVDIADLGFDGVEAVAVWGEGHGPAVLVNQSGRHAQGDEGMRATLAHELCHLLVDRADALPLAEVLGGSAPTWPEQRANAFAAELLLPKRIAGEALASCKTASEARAAVKRLTTTYGASRTIVAWQAVRSEERVRPAVVTVLRELVPAKDRARFDDAVARS